MLREPSEKLEIEGERDQKKEQEVENARKINGDIDRDPGLIR